jgi:uncharacterized protein
MTLNRSLVNRLIKTLLVLYIAGGFTVYFLQDKVLFKPTIVAADKTLDILLPHRELNIAYAKDENMSIVVFPTSDSTPRGAVLYFHGNKGNVERYAPAATTFTSKGFEVWMVDYPGYGKSTGKISEQKMYDYANTVYRLAHTRFAGDSLIIYGRSLGSGPATWLASKHNVHRLILETPYYDMQSLFRHFVPFYPVSILARHKFPIGEFMKDVIAPVTIFHGTSDMTIPYSNATQLRSSFKKGDEFVTIEGGSHNDIANFPQYREKMDSLLRH